MWCKLAFIMIAYYRSIKCNVSVSEFSTYCNCPSKTQFFNSHFLHLLTADQFEILQGVMERERGSHSELLHESLPATGCKTFKPRSANRRCCSLPRQQILLHRLVGQISSCDKEKCFCRCTEQTLSITWPHGVTGGVWTSRYTNEASRKMADNYKCLNFWPHRQKRVTNHHWLCLRTTGNRQKYISCLCLLVN